MNRDEKVVPNWETAHNVFKSRLLDWCEKEFKRPIVPARILSVWPFCVLVTGIGDEIRISEYQMWPRWRGLRWKKIYPLQQIRSRRLSKHLGKIIEKSLWMKVLFEKNLRLNPFPHIDTFWRLCSRQIFENIVTKE